MQVGSEPFEYEYRQDYGGTVSGDGTHHGSGYYNHGNVPSLYRWSTDPNLAEISYETYSQSHSHPGVAGTFTTAHYVPNSGPPYKTGNQRGGAAIYQQQPIYEYRPVYSTAYAYEVRLERNIGGSVVPIIAKAVGAAALSTLRVTAQGPTIALYSSASPTTPHGTTNDATHSTATKLGVGHSEASELGNTTGLDEFRAVAYNTPPGMPTLLAPVGSEPVNNAAQQTFRLAQNDPDAGDVISRTEWEWQLTSGGTVLTAQQNGPAATITPPGGTFSAGAWRWRARTFDRAAAASPWSGYEFFTAGTIPDAPQITSPTNNATLSDTSTPVTWSAVNQDAYELRVLGDLNGSPNPADVLVPATTVQSTTRTATVGRLANNRTEHTQVRVRYLGLWSEWGTVKNLVLFTPPALARLALAVDARRGYVLATIAHLAPTGGQPAVAYAELWRRVVGRAKETLVATGLGVGTYTDAKVQHRSEYEYRVRTYGVNGSWSDTAWVAEATGGGDVVVILPAPVLQVPATEVTLTGFRSSWQPVAGSSDYLVERRAAGAELWTGVAVVADTTYLHTGLTSSTSYSVRVIARRAGVSGLPSAPVTTTTAGVPLTNVRTSRSSSWQVTAAATPAQSTVTVSTTPPAGAVPQPHPAVYSGPTLAVTFREEFTGEGANVDPVTGVDRSVWSYGEPDEVEKNGGAGYYKNEAWFASQPPASVCQVSNGTLKMRARRDSTAATRGAIASACALTTRQKYKTFRHGFAEFRFRVDLGKSAWPAIWSLSNGGYGETESPQWPEGGEWDWWEQYNAHDISGVDTSNLIYGRNADTVYGPAGTLKFDNKRHGDVAQRGTQYKVREYIGDGQFHTLTIHRTSQFIKKYIDGVLIYSWVPGELSNDFYKEGQTPQHEPMPAHMFDSRIHWRLDMQYGDAGRYNVPAGTPGAIERPRLFGQPGTVWVLYEESTLEVDWFRTWETA